jgi:hypothetical protein
VQPEQPDTPASEDLPVADPLPVAKPVRKKKRDPAEIAREAARLQRSVRIVLLVIALGLAGVFAAAFRIYPYDEDGQPRTMSTHTQLGLPPCNFVVMTGKPCPSCGMTTSFALLVRGDVSASLRANWVGSFICVLWAGTLVWAVASAAVGRVLIVPPHRKELVVTCLVGLVVVLMLGRWAVYLLQ